MPPSSDPRLNARSPGLECFLYMQGMLQKSYRLVDPPPLYKLRHLIGSNGQSYFVNHKQILRNLAEPQMLNIAFLVSYCEL